MRIERITEIEPVLACMPFEQNIRNKGRDKNSISNMLLAVKENISNPTFGFWIAYEGKKIVGYLSAVASLVKPLRRVVVWRIYAPKVNVQNEFKSILIGFGKEHRIKPGVVRVEVFKNEKVFERKGWEKISTIMEKRLY